MLYFGIFGHKFQKTIVIFEISTLKFSKLKNFLKKQKCLNLGRSKTYFSIFLPRTRKCYCRIWNQHPQIFQMTKFLKKKTKMPKFVTINALSGHFWARILKSCCRIWDQHHQICQIAKFCEKAKMAKYGIKNAWSGYFWAGILKFFCHIWNQHPQICVIANFYKKTKGPKFLTKNALFAYF